MNVVWCFNWGSGRGRKFVSRLKFGGDDENGVIQISRNVLLTCSYDEVRRIIDLLIYYLWPSS